MMNKLIDFDLKMNKKLTFSLEVLILETFSFLFAIATLILFALVFDVAFAFFTRVSVFGIELLKS